MAPVVPAGGACGRGRGRRPTGSAWREFCASCGRSWSLTDLRWRCACGGLLDLVGPLADPFPAPARNAAAPLSPLRRYRAALPPGAGTVDLGLTITPVAEVRPGVYVKADYEHPTGSFKDRGASVMLGGAAALGVPAVVADSSGNAGKAAAAHAAAAGIECTVYLPAATVATKVAGISKYGATVVEVSGDRGSGGRRRPRPRPAGRSLRGRWYASHVHQPAVPPRREDVGLRALRTDPGTFRAGR